MVQVAILHRGRLQCVGTTAELKAAHGTSYHLTVSRSPNGASSGELLDLAKQTVPDARLEAESTDEVALRLPQTAVGEFSALFTSIDTDVDRLGVLAYGLSIPTLQEVFMQITAEADQRDVCARRIELRSARALSPTCACAPRGAGRARRARRRHAKSGGPGGGPVADLL